MTKWQQLKLGEIATFVNGYAFKPSDWNDIGIPIIRIQNLTNDNASRNYYNGQLDEKYRVVRGDILISWSATIGVFEWTREDSYLNQHIFKVVFNKLKVNKSFFKYLIKQKINEMLAKVHGSTMKHITKSNFDNIPILLPDIKEQDRIARILDKAEEIRTKKKLANEKLDEFLKSTFIDMFGDPITNPKGYKKELIKNICSTATGSTPSRDNPQYYQNAIISWVKTGEVLNSYIKKTEERISQKAIDETNCKIFPVNTNLVAMYGQGLTRGRVGMLKIEAATNQACCAILSGEKINQEFLFNLLKLEYETLRNLGRGGNQPNLNKGMINDFVIYLPPLEQQNQFAQIVQKVEAQKENNQEIIEQMDNLFNSLMQQAFNSGL